VSLTAPASRLIMVQVESQTGLWDGVKNQKKNKINQPPVHLFSIFLVNKYHNESQLSFGDNTQQVEDEEKKRE